MIFLPNVIMIYKIDYKKGHFGQQKCPE